MQKITRQTRRATTNNQLYRSPVIHGVLVIHGGAGGDTLLGKTPLDPARIDCMKQALQQVGSKLESGEIDCLEAVTLAVEMLEDEPLFNAGQGSVIGR